MKPRCEPTAREALVNSYLERIHRLKPATPAAAPRGLASTGNPIFCTLWSLCGVSALSLPLLAGEADLPLGLQIVAARGKDSRLPQAAQWREKTRPTDQS